MSRPSDDKKFDEMLSACGASIAGRRWALNALNVFSDTDQAVGGMPDEVGGLSYILNIKREMGITKPSFLLPGEKWDAHIVFFPHISDIINPVQVVSARYSDDGQINPHPGIITAVGWAAQGGVMVVCKVKAGDNTFDPNSPGTTPAEYQVLTVPALAEDNRIRMIGGAYEVHNTTEELYKGGSVTDWRAESDGMEVNPLFNPILLNVAPPVGIALPVGGYMFTLPPCTIGSAKQCGGVSREAAAGSLVPLCFSNFENHVPHLDTRPLIGIQRDVNRNSPTDNAYVWCGQDTPAVNAQGWWHAGNAGDSMPGHRHFAFKTSGSYYSGLNENSSLNLLFHGYFEVFPDPGSLNMSIATPSPGLDVCALEVVSSVQSRLLAGYPVSENAAGDFFRRVLGFVRDKVLPIVSKIATPLAVLPGPAGAIAKGISMASTGGMAALSLVPKPKKKKETQKNK